MSRKRRSILPKPEDRLIHGDCLAILKRFDSNSVDLICTDPPYGIGFQNREWDTFAPAYLARNVRDSSRKNVAVAKAEGGDIASAAFSSARYDHTPAGARRFREWLQERAEQWLRVLKPGAFAFVCIGARQDSVAAAIGGLTEAGFKTDFTSLYWTYASGFPKALNIGKAIDKRLGKERAVIGYRKVQDIRGGRYGASRRQIVKPLRGAPVSPEARRLDRCYAGFQPKPAVEVIVVAMKPLFEPTHLDQALTNGKGVTWFDACRIPSDASVCVHDAPGGTFAGGPPGRGSNKLYRQNSAGRFPANLLVSDDALGAYSRFFSLDAWAETLPFLIVPKAGKRERPQQAGLVRHPTVKPLKLMAYLIALGSQPGDIVLDPFVGSGTTAVAAKLLGRRFIGIDREKDYIAIAEARLAAIAGGRVAAA